MVKLVIDGQQVEVEERLTVLEAARKMGIKIPTLCYHPAVSAYGACRVCTVEVIRKGWSRLTAACTYPVQEGSEIKTNSEKVKKARKLIVEMLLARCPNVKAIQNLARGMGVEKIRFPQEDKKCILCGLCVRVCAEVIGASAIGFVNRGTERKPTTPFEIQSDTCIGCGACAMVCPTGAIKIEDIEDKRKIDRWHTELERAKCEKCGRYFSPQATIDYVKKKNAEKVKNLLELCPDCRRDILADKLNQVKYKGDLVKLP
jgi:bidirectional [NiFe] hydrogenase diaphorase subunit